VRETERGGADPSASAPFHITRACAPWTRAPRGVEALRSVGPHA
jgi:hypothetical protein